MKVPVILGTPTIHRVCRQMKETELKTAPEEWQHALISYEVAQEVTINSMAPTDPNQQYPTNTGQDPTDLDEVVLLKSKTTIPAFATQIVGARTKHTFLTTHRLNVMIQPPYPEDQAHLPVGLYVQRVYTELKEGSQNVSMVLRNGTGKPIHLPAGRLIGRVVAANVVP
ncbi:MAG: hypothetical protein MJE68_05870, partial [Proteobacteria bacterium]|nr:hypothetical protein [Pseudomonadota bacterium]